MGLSGDGGGKHMKTLRRWREDRKGRRTRELMRKWQRSYFNRWSKIFVSKNDTAQWLLWFKLGWRRLIIIIIIIRNNSSSTSSRNINVFTGVKFGEQDCGCLRQRSVGEYLDLRRIEKQGRSDLYCEPYDRGGSLLQGNLEFVYPRTLKAVLLFIKLHVLRPTGLSPRCVVFHTAHILTWVWRFAHESNNRLLWKYLRISLFLQSWIYLRTLTTFK